MTLSQIAITLRSPTPFSVGDLIVDVAQCLRDFPTRLNPAVLADFDRRVCQLAESYSPEYSESARVIARRRLASLCEYGHLLHVAHLNGTLHDTIFT